MTETAVPHRQTEPDRKTNCQMHRRHLHRNTHSYMQKDKEKKRGGDRGREREIRRQRDGQRLHKKGPQRNTNNPEIQIQADIDTHKHTLTYYTDVHIALTKRFVAVQCSVPVFDFMRSPSHTS